MSQAESSDSPRGVYTQKPKADIYTVMLVIALVAILIACTLLFLEMKAYNYDIRAQEGRLFGSVEQSFPYALRTPPAAADAWSASPPACTIG